MEHAQKLLLMHISNGLRLENSCQHGCFARESVIHCCHNLYTAREQAPYACTNHHFLSLESSLSLDYFNSWKTSNVLCNSTKPSLLALSENNSNIRVNLGGSRVNRQYQYLNPCHAYSHLKIKTKKKTFEMTPKLWAITQHFQLDCSLAEQVLFELKESFNSNSATQTFLVLLTGKIQTDPMWNTVHTMHTVHRCPLPARWSVQIWNGKYAWAFFNCSKHCERSTLQKCTVALLF